MNETGADLERLQALLDSSIERATQFLRASFEMPEKSLSVGQLVAHLTGSLTVALATVTAGGEPRVAPINAFLLRAHFYVPTVVESARARHLAARPGVSLTYYEGRELAVIVHGKAQIIDERDERFEELDLFQTGRGRQSPREWSGRAAYLQVIPGTIYKYASEPDRYPSAGATE
jgi:nitroimidazol reductase NimA-like FMN-containing flavoprotein (pyridoxamine 5'-phosphate oxidase superfamily)